MKRVRHGKFTRVQLTRSSIDFRVQELNEKAPANIVLALVGNKIDLEDSRVVKKADAEEYAKSLGLAYNEVSAKQNIGIE